MAISHHNANYDLEQVLNKLPNGVRIVDKNYTVVWLNDALAKMAGVSKHETLGKKCYESFPGERCHTAGCPLTRILAGEPEFSDQYTKVCGDGAGIPCLVVAKPFNSRDGELLGIIEDFRDISEIKKASEDLKQSERKYRLLAENVSDVIWTADLNLRFTYASPSIVQLLNYRPEEVLDRSLGEFLTSVSFSDCREALKHKLNEGSSQEPPRSVALEMEFIDKAGVAVWTNSKMNFLRNPEGEPLAILGVTRDIRERKQAQEELREREARLRAIFENGAVGIALMDREGRIEESNEALQKMLGFNKRELHDKTFIGLTHPEDAPEDLALFQELVAGKRNEYHLEKRCLRKDGSSIWVQKIVSPIPSKTGELRFTLSMVQDVTQRKQAELLSHDLFFTSPIGVYIVQESKFRLANESFQQITGYGQSELIGMKSLTLVLPQDRNAVRREAVKMLKGVRPLPYQFRTVTKSGETKWVLESVTSTQYQGRRATLGYFMDITSHKLMEEKLQTWVRKYQNQVGKLKKSEATLKYLSIRDGLTGLINHKEFHHRLQEEWERARRHGRLLSLLMLDLDFFKQINDTYGHRIGDEVLCVIAALIKEEVRLVDLVARYGGEEFAIILPETSNVSALEIAERIRNTVASHKIVCSGDQAVAVTISIGAASFPDHASSDEKLIIAADEALYAAKHSGRNRVCGAHERTML